MTDRPLSHLAQRLNYAFRDDTLLREALTHRSAGAVNNERLEFLGDSILNFVIAAELYRRYPDLREGDLSRLRASLVNGESLADIAADLELGEYILLGAGEKRSGGHRRKSILADSVEGIIGAVFCDSDFDTCKSLILGLYTEKLANIPDLDSLKDAKTRLQELLQSRQIAIPNYSVLSVSGKPHQQVFKVNCVIEALAISVEGEGSSRRRAEQQAAEAAFISASEKIGS